MGEQEPADRLTLIKTHWAMLFQAHQDLGDAASAAQRELLLRYYGAVYRYLLGILRDPAAAEELTQEFAVRFLRGDFSGADPRRGRFRDFLKAALRHLAVDYWRQQRKTPLPLADAGAGLAAGDPSVSEAFDQAFVDNWRQELLARTWEALAQAQAETGQPYHTVLRWKTEHPEVRSAQLADRLRTQEGRPFSEESTRQLLHRARKRFAEALVEEVARSLQTSAPEEVTQELIDLGLLAYCRPALEKRRRSP